MPIKQYDCEDCKAQHDVIIRTIEDVPVRCGFCGSEKLVQAVTAMGGIRGSFGTVPKKGSGSFRRSRGKS